jgi:uncharacterized protein YbjT (DUF2867 family)
MRIAVAGATGRVGRHIVDVLKEQGHDAIAMSRGTGVDVITGEGLAGALAGADAIIDAATGPSPDEAESVRFFSTAAGNLQRAGAEAGVRRLVIVSIIGIDKLTAGYNVAKLAHERVALAGPIPAQVLRAAQFHEFVPVLMQWGRQGDVCHVGRMRTQLVAARTVAEGLVALATAADFPAGRVQEIAGPREESLVDMATLYASRHGDPVKVEGVSDPNNPDQELFETGALLPGPGATLAGPTFEDWVSGLSS